MTRRTLSSSLLAALACACGASMPAPHPAPPPPLAVVEAVPLPPASSGPDRRGGPTAPAKITVVTDHVMRTHRLGSALFVSLLLGDEAHPTIRLARIDDDGTVTDVAAAMPSSRRTMSRGGHEVLSGTPSALLGEPDGPIWMAFESYSTWGSAQVYRAVDGRWACVGRCTDNEPEPWARITETRMPTGERVASGDLVTERSRGHLFAVRNRVSGEGPQYVLPRAKVLDPVRTVKAIREVDGDLVELADGSIVDIEKTVPEAKAVRHVEGWSAQDFWVLDETDLIHVQGTVHERVALPDKDVSALVADEDAVWISGGAFAYQIDGPDRGSTVRIAANVVAARRRVLFAWADANLLRVELE